MLGIVVHYSLGSCWQGILMTFEVDFTELETSGEHGKMARTGYRVCVG